MGYYTYHTLESDDNKDHTDNIREFLEDAYLFEESTKWYDIVEDMKRYSLEHPTVLFTVQGLGEDGDAHWKAYFRNGKSCRTQGEITFTPFNQLTLI